MNNLSGTTRFQYVCANGLVSNPRIVGSGLLLNLNTKSDSVTVLVPNILQYVYAGNDAFNDLWSKLQTKK